MVAPALVAKDGEREELISRAAEEGVHWEEKEAPATSQPSARSAAAAALRGSGRGFSVLLTLLFATGLAIVARGLLPDSAGRVEAAAARAAASISKAEASKILVRPASRTFGPRRRLVRRRLAGRTPRAAKSHLPAGVPSWVAEAVGLAEDHDRCELPASEDKDWSQLSKAEQVGADALGWTEELWNCDGEQCKSPETSETSWTDLSEKERAGAKALGWTSVTWELPNSAGLPWDDLSDRERAAATTLGFAEESWNCEGDSCTEPPSNSLCWDELSEAQRAAAAELGYTRATWDQC